MSDIAGRLSALAAGLCQDAGIRLEVHPGPWDWDPLRKVFRVPSGELEARGLAYCAGVLSREVGRSYLSRHRLFPIDFRSLTAGRLLLDAIEVGRVDDWMQRRYPGTAPWLQAAADGKASAKPGDPAFLQFVAECSAEPQRGWVASSKLPEVVTLALEWTRPARQFYADFQPPVDADPYAEPNLFRRYRAEVRPARITPGWPPTREEQLVQLRALEALRLAEDYVFPIAEHLLGHDLEKIEAYLARGRPVAAHARRCLEAGEASRVLLEALARGCPPAKPSQRPTWLRDLAAQLLEQHLLGHAPRGVITSATDPERRSEGLPPRLPPDLPPLKLPPGRPTDYDRAYARVAAQVERLTQHLDEVLTPKKRSRARAGYPSGRRVDLNKLMQFDADPRRYDTLWVRTSIPDRRSVAVSLLVDLSGSMQGEKADSAVLGTILLAETLARLQIPFAVNGFQDVLIPMAQFAGTQSGALGAEARQAIAAMPLEVSGNRDGGNNRPAYNDDGPCVREAALELEAHPANDRILVVVSDGLPEGRRSDESDLHAAIAELSGLDSPVRLIALGLGPSTEHVSRYYPDSVANVPVTRFSEEIGKLVERIVLQ